MKLKMMLATVMLVLLFTVVSASAGCPKMVDSIKMGDHSDYAVREISKVWQSQPSSFEEEENGYFSVYWSNEVGTCMASFTNKGRLYWFAMIVSTTDVEGLQKLLENSLIKLDDAGAVLLSEKETKKEFSLEFQCENEIHSLELTRNYDYDSGVINYTFMYGIGLNK